MDILGFLGWVGIVIGAFLLFGVSLVLSKVCLWPFAPIITRGYGEKVVRVFVKFAILSGLSMLLLGFADQQTWQDALGFVGIVELDAYAGVISGDAEVVAGCILLGFTCAIYEMQSAADDRRQNARLAFLIVKNGLPESQKLFEQSMYGPFWDSMERVMDNVMLFRRTAYDDKKAMSREIAEMPFLEKEMEHLVSVAQSDINFALIYEQRQYRRVAEKENAALRQALEETRQQAAQATAAADSASRVASAAKRNAAAAERRARGDLL